MPADFSDYVDLTPYDINPVDVYFGAIELARLTLPEFTLRQGTVDDAIFQAMSYVTTLNTAAINRIPSRLMEGVARILGVQRDEGTRASFTITLVSNSYTGFTVPAGTTFAHQISVGGTVQEYVYELIDSVTIPDVANPQDGDSYPYATGQVKSTLAGVHPEVTNFTELVCQQVIPELYLAHAGTDFSNGLNPESDETYLARCTSSIASLSGTFASASQMRSYVATTFSNVSRVKVYDLTNGDAAGGLQFTTADAKGYVSCFAYGVDRFLTNSELYDIQLDLTNKTIAGVYIGAYNFTLLDVGATLNVIHDESYTSVDIADDVKNAVYGYLNPAGFNANSEAIRVNEIAAVARAVPGVNYVESVQLDDTGGNVSAGFATRDSVQNLIFSRKGLLPTSLLSNIIVTASPG